MIVRKFRDRNMLGCDLLSVVRLGIGALPYLEYLKYIGDRIAERNAHTALDHLVFVIRKNRIKNEFLNDPMRGLRVHAGELRLSCCVYKEKFRHAHLSRYFTVPSPVTVCKPTAGMIQRETML